MEGILSEGDAKKRAKNKVESDPFLKTKTEK